MTQDAPGAPPRGTPPAPSVTPDAPGAPPRGTPPAPSVTPDASGEPLRGTPPAHSVIVRPVAEGDFDQWISLWDSYNEFYERTLPRDITETTWRRLLDADGPVHALVVDDQARIVGLAHYLFHASTTAVGQTCYLQDLFTVADVRGQGVGRTLIEAVAERAAAAGAQRLYWQTKTTNTTARALYDRVATDTGFMVYARGTAP